MIKSGLLALIFFLGFLEVARAEKEVKMTNLEDERMELLLKDILTEDEPFLAAGLTLAEEDEFKEGLRDYNEKNYALAAEKFGEILKGQKSETVMFYLAESVLKTAASEGTSFNQAIDLYRAAVRKFPEGENAARGLLLLGRINMKRKFFAEAQAFLKKVIKDYPESIYVPSAKFWLGINYQVQKKYNDALPLYEEILKEEKKPTSFVPTGKGGKRRDWGTSPEKIKAIKSAAFWGMGDLHYLMGNYPEARKQYEKGMAADLKEINKRPISLFNLAQIYFLLPDYQKALEKFNEFVSNYPDIGYSALAWGKIGDLQTLSGKYPEAERSYTKALNQKQGGVYSEIWAKIGTAALYLKMGGKKVQILSYAELLEKYPGVKLDEEILLKLGRLFMDGQMYADALQSFSGISAKYPGEIRKCLIIIMEEDHKQGKYFEVIRAFEKNKKSLTEEGVDSKLGFLIGDSYTKIGMALKANSFLEEALHGAGKEERASLVSQMARTEFSEGRWEQAKKLFKEVLEKNPPAPTALSAARHIGFILYKEKKYAEAWNYYETWMSQVVHEIGKEGKLVEALNEDFLEADSSSGKAALRIRFIEMVVGDKVALPTPAQLWLILGNSYFEEKSYPRAIKAFREGIILSPEGGKIGLVAYQLAQSFSATNNNPEALKALETSGEKNIFRNLGREYIRTIDLKRRVGQLN